MVLRPWTLLSPDPDRVRALSTAHALREETAKILVNRGIDEPDAAARFLEPRLAELRPPSGMAGFERSVARLEEAILAGEVIGVFGDYDVDGATTTALLTSFFRGAGAARVEARVAARDRGYGFGLPDAAALRDLGCTLIVTCDCGTSDLESLTFARQQGIDVIVVDHHQVPEGQSPAYAMINPHQRECRFPFKGLASVGVGFYLAAALRTRLRALGRAGESDAADPRRLLDLVAVGTIADQAPLREENRILVHHGLRQLQRSGRPGLRALMSVGSLDPGLPRTEVDVAFRLAPRMNAPGRLGDARPTLELLLATSESEAERWAATLDEANRRRQSLEEGVLAEALELARVRLSSDEPPVLVVAKQGWHPGVLGIVAAKLVDRYARPAVVIGLEGVEGRGSARSCNGFHLVEGMRRCAEHLVRFGGHAQAAGLTVRADRVEELAAGLNAAALAAHGAWAGGRLDVDAEVCLSRVDEKLAAELARLRPFGAGNAEPLLTTSARTLSSRVVGREHLRLTLSGEAGLLAREAIAFRMAARDPGPNAAIDLAFTPEIDHFRGSPRLQLRVRDLRPSAP